MPGRSRAWSVEGASGEAWVLESELDSEDRRGCWRALVRPSPGPGDKTPRQAGRRSWARDPDAGAAGSVLHVQLVHVQQAVCGHGPVRFRGGNHQFRGRRLAAGEVLKILLCRVREWTRVNYTWELRSSQ